MSRYFLFVFYVAISLLIGKEFHPFSTFPMFNSFPNYGYVFFLKNERDEVVTYGRNFAKSKNAGYVAHTYYSFFNSHNYSCGFGEEDSAHVREAGKVLLEMILKDENTDALDFDSLKIYRRFYFLENEQLTFRDDLMYEDAVRP
jgi:hypothetical protein